jgi:hypothetical protein
MSIIVLIACILCLNWGGDPAASAPGTSETAPSAPVAAENPDAAAALTFAELFVMPVGPRGAEYTPRAKELAGKRVRLSGYMVRRATYTPGRCILTSSPIQLNEREMGMADDLPVNATWIDMPGGRGGFSRVSGRIEVTGRLSLGPRRESDGRVSHVRVIAESIVPSTGDAGAKAVVR